MFNPSTRKKIITLFLSFFVVFSFTGISFAQTEYVNDNINTQDFGVNNTLNVNDPSFGPGSETGDGEQTSYTLLQPLASDGSTTTSISIKSGGLSSYLQIVFQYVLVTVTVIAIFMLIYGGMEYLTTDIVNRKSAGKETILRALSGIVFIFCVWFILNLINPDLAKTALDLGVGAINNTTASITGTGTSTRSTPARVVATCPEGIVSVGSAQVCRSIAENVQKLLDDAKAAGINITVQGSWRSPDRQIALRKQNCGSSEYDIYTKPSNQCNPQTAIPGSSNHEKGLALDLGVGGASFCYNAPKTESAQSSCAASNAGYQWMKANAGKYGLLNNIPLTKEAWHWSTTGN